jgi:uncharacterized protein YbjQ (UPF0145 family)
MGLFDFLTGGSEDEDPEAALRREEDVARVEGGSIPLAAERRMRELAAGTTSFTSGLSVADFALCRQAGVRPVAQVMGSSVYNVGWTRYPWSPSWQGEATFVELEALTDAWNDARSRALARLAEEAALAGSHAVVDVTFGGTRHEFLSDEIEIVVNGTAVVLADGARDDGRPVLTGLSMPDYVRLRDAGHEPVGIAAASSVFYVVPSAATQSLTSGWQRFQPNQELVDYTQGLYSARERALARERRGLALRRHRRRRPVDRAGRRGPRGRGQPPLAAGPRRRLPRRRHEHRARRRASASSARDRRPTRSSQPMSTYEPGSLEGVPEAGRARLEQNRRGLFTSDLSVSEFLLVKQAATVPSGW